MKQKIKPDKQMIANALLTRSALLSTLLDTENRNINQECGYPDTITAEQYKEMYEREGVARRIIRCLPAESWPFDPLVYETEDSNETEFETTWETLTKEINLFHYLQRIDELSGIGRFGLLLLGIDDGKELSQPVEGVDQLGRKSGKSEYSLLYVRVFDESVVTINASETDKTNPRYGLPTLYSIIFQDDETNTTGRTEMVHWTRVLHVADDRTMSEVYGTPRLKPVYNRLMDMRKILSGSGEMFWRGAFPGYSFEVNPELNDQGATIDPVAMREEFENYSNGLQRYLALTGVTAKSLSPQVADPTGHLEANLKSIAISLGVPFRILFGSEQAQLASGQDAKNWSRRIEHRQSKYLTPLLLRPLVDRLIAYGVLPEPAEVLIEWPDLMGSTDEDKARIAQMRTQALAQYVQGRVSELIPPATYLMQIIGMDQEEVDSIMKEVEEQQEEEDQQAAQDQQAIQDQQGEQNDQEVPGKGAKPPTTPPDQLPPTENLDPDAV